MCVALSFKCGTESLSALRNWAFVSGEEERRDRVEEMDEQRFMGIQTKESRNKRQYPSCDDDDWWRDELRCDAGPHEPQTRLPRPLVHYYACVLLFTSASTVIQGMGLKR